MLGRVFDMFTQTDPVGGTGLGLGLTLVDRLVRLHGGTVVAESPGVGLGSTFVVRLPAEAASEASAHAASSEAETIIVEATPGATGRVVVIEDNDDVRDLLCALLKRWGFAVAAADNGESGIELVKNIRPEFALVDIGMPGLDGYGVARRLRTEASSGTLRLVAMTGYGQERDKQRAFDAGFDTHLVKPVDPMLLRRVLSGDTTNPAPQSGPKD
jgi:two-component system CheB/CheR fusion protein